MQCNWHWRMLCQFDAASDANVIGVLLYLVATQRRLARAGVASGLWRESRAARLDRRLGDRRTASRSQRRDRSARRWSRAEGGKNGGRRQRGQHSGHSINSAARLRSLLLLLPIVLRTDRLPRLQNTVPARSADLGRSRRGQGGISTLILCVQAAIAQLRVSLSY
jgi:hypothetical protein